MAKATKKVFAGMTSKAPAKKPYAISHQEFIGNPSMQGGKTAKAKADYKKAVKGGAAKTAAKAVKDVKTVSNINTRTGSMFNSRSNVTTVASRAAERKAMAQRIINDKSKTSTRAKIVEMNAIKKTKKSK
jgi:hypothetical protein